MRTAKRYRSNVNRNSKLVRRKMTEKYEELTRCIHDWHNYQSIDTFDIIMKCKKCGAELIADSLLIQEQQYRDKANSKLHTIGPGEVIRVNRQ